MRVILDTNVVISGIFWGGHPRRILDLARSGEITICTSQALLDELLDVLSRPKFANKLALRGDNVRETVDGYAALTEVVIVTEIEPIVVDDPDDDEVIACAIAAEVSYIISGDRHLLNLLTHGSIQIVTAAQFIAIRRESLGI